MSTRQFPKGQGSSLFIFINQLFLTILPHAIVGRSPEKVRLKQRTIKYLS